MRWFVLIAVPLLSFPAFGDDFTDLLLEHDRTRTFCAEYGRAMLTVGVHNLPAPGQEAGMMPIHYGTAVAVKDRDGKTHLLTASLLAYGGKELFLSLPSGKRQVVRQMRTLGDGALVELIVDSKVLPTNLQPLTLYDGKSIQSTMLIFAIANPGAQFPMLVRGAVLELLSGPLTGLLVNDIPAPHGTALMTATGHLVGINYRRFPKRDKHSIAISAETIGEWLHSKGPTLHSSASAR